MSVELIISGLFALSAMLFVVYFGDLLTEKRTLNDRMQILRQNQTAADAALQKNLLTLDFYSKKGHLHRFFSLTTPPSFALMMGALVIWVGLSFGIFVFLKKFPLFNRAIVVFVLFLLVYRFMGVAAKKQRLAKIQKELPGVMDLLVVCLEAGLALNSALLRVANELGDSPLGNELKQTLNEVTAGIPIDMALRNLARRTDLPDLNAIVSSVIQAQKMGMALAETFRVQADSLREKIRMRLREQMAKIPIKIIFPLVFFIFPALFIVILGPAVINISRNLFQQ